MASRDARWLKREAMNLRAWARALRLRCGGIGEDMLIAAELDETAEEAERLAERSSLRLE